MTIIYNKSANLQFRKELRNNMTKSETVLWKHLKGKQVGFKFRRQFGIGPYIIDFYCPALRFAIEVDGLTHAFEKVYEKDIERQKYLEYLGIIVKRYSSQDIFYKLDQILEDIYQTCSKLTSSVDPSLPSPS